MHADKLKVSISMFFILFLLALAPSIGTSQDLSAAKTKSQGTLIVDEKELSYQEASKVLIKKIKEGNRQEQFEATQILIKRPEDFILDKETISTLIELFHNLPPVSPMEERRKDNIKELESRMKITTYVLISTSQDERAASIYEEVMKGNDELMKKGAEGVKTFEKEQKESAVYDEAKKYPMKFSFSIVTAKELEIFLPYMFNCPVRGVGTETLEQIGKNYKYLKEERNDDKRRVVIEALKNYYTKVDSFQRPDIITILSYLGKEEEIKPFLDKIISDKKTNWRVKEAAEKALQWLKANK